MPKIKTHKGTKKRFRVTKSGQAKRWRAGRRHLLSGKPAKRRRRLRQPAICRSMDTKRILSLLAGSKG